VSIAHRVLIDVARLRLFRDEKVGRSLISMEEIGVGRGRGTPG
jgi:hypothetical protein